MEPISVFTEAQRRWRYSLSEKLQAVQESGHPAMTVAYAARKYDIYPHRLFK